MLLGKHVLVLQKVSRRKTAFTTGHTTVTRTSHVLALSSGRLML